MKKKSPHEPPILTSPTDSSRFHWLSDPVVVLALVFFVIIALAKIF